MTQMRKVKNTKKGFSMGEAVISVFVVAIGLVATINLIVSGLSHSMDSRDHIIASQLAQGGVELVRNIRDNDWAVGNNSFVSMPTSNNCRIDYTGSSSLQCGLSNNGNDYTLSYSGNYYKWDVLNKTKFNRRIAIQDPGDGTREIVSIVSWKNEYITTANCNTSNKCVYTRSVLTKWGE